MEYTIYQNDAFAIELTPKTITVLMLIWLTKQKELEMYLTICINSHEFLIHSLTKISARIALSVRLSGT